MSIWQSDADSFPIGTGYTDQAGILLLDITLKDQCLRLIEFYAPSDHVERYDLFRWIEPFLATSRRVDLAEYWDFLLDHNIDGIGEISGTDNQNVNTFRNFIDKFDLLDKYRYGHPREVV